MPADEAVPPPEDTGVEGKQIEQEPSSTKALVQSYEDSQGGIEEHPLSGAVRQLLEAGVRGESGMTLLSAHIASVTQELQSCREKYDDLCKQLTKEKVEAAVAKEKLRTSRAENSRRTIMLTVGALIAGSTVAIFGESFVFGIIGLVVGFALILGAAWPGPGKGGG